jgi:hypothetical protein
VPRWDNVPEAHSRDSPWGVILIVRGVFYHVCVLTVVFLLNNIKAADRGVYAAAAAVDLGIYFQNIIGFFFITL